MLMPETKLSNMRKAEEIIPGDLWMIILGMLNFSDQCSMLLVSQYIYQLGTHPSLTRNVKISSVYISRFGFTQLFSVTKSPRFDSIQHLDLSNFFQNTREWSYFFKKVYVLKKFPDLKLTYVNLCDVPSSLLAKGISVMRKVDLYRTRLRTKQSRAILGASLDSTTLQELNLGWVNLSRVPSSILGRAVARLRLANLEYTWLRPLQVRTILRESLHSTSLQDLDLQDVAMHGVPPRLLARALCRLVSVNLRRSRLSKDQAEAVLNVIPDSTKLITLDMGHYIMGQDPQFLKMASEAITLLKKKRLDAGNPLVSIEGLLLCNILSLTYEQ